jgi:hypothetical protein
LQALVGLAEVLVDDHVVVFRPPIDLDPRIGETLRDRLGRILRPPHEPGFQLAHAGGQDEHGYDVLGQLLAHLARALVIDVEDHVLAGREGAFHGLTWRAVEVAVHLGPFEEVAPVAHVEELIAVDEVVMTSLDFGGTPLAGRHGNRQFAGTTLDQAAGQGRLPGARGRRQDEDQAAAADLWFSMEGHGLT